MVRALRFGRRRGRWARLGALGYATIATLGVKSAYGTPEFARQTELSCGACHLHVPLLNEFGQRFFANGFKLGKKPEPMKTVPAWASIMPEGTVAESEHGAIPIEWDCSEVGSFGFCDPIKLLYSFLWEPTDGSTQYYALHPINQRFAVQAGQFGLLSQYDTNLEISLSTPVFLLPEGAGSLGNGRNGPFAPGAQAYAVRATAALDSGSSMPYSDGWKVSTTVPFSPEVAYGQQAKWGSSPTGAFVEAYRRIGMDSLGVNSFTGKDGRHEYGLAATARVQRFYFQGGLADELFLGAQSHTYSAAVDWVPAFDKAVGFRIDNQDGFYNYIPTLSYILGGQQYAVLKLIVETTITKGVAPTTEFSLQALF